MTFTQREKKWVPLSSPCTLEVYSDRLPSSTAHSNTTLSCSLSCVVGKTALLPPSVPATSRHPCEVNTTRRRGVLKGNSSLPAAALSVPLLLLFPGGRCRCCCCCCFLLLLLSVLCPAAALAAAALAACVLHGHHHHRHCLPDSHTRCVWQPVGGGPTGSAFVMVLGVSSL